MVDVVKEEVFVSLRSLSSAQLEEVCTSINVIVPEEKKTKKNAVMNAVQRYLSSEEIEDSEDEGLQVFQQLNEMLKKLLGPAQPSPAVKTEAGVTGGGGGTSTQTSSSLQQQSATNPPIVAAAPVSQVSSFDVKKIKLRDFKVSGVVGAEKGNVKWGSLCFKMKEGLSQGYSERDIMLGVIGAMKEGSAEQTYFQLSVDDSMTHKIFLGMLRSLYGVQDSDKLCNEMVACIQEPSESLKTYFMRMDGYRKNIMAVTNHEDCPLSEVLVRKRFTNALLVGLRNPTIRLELKPVFLASCPVPDHELLAIVNEITAREAENERKFGLKTAGTKAVKVVEEKDFCTIEEGKILAQL